jgi:O-6-methylguanine DNA methyltransferase
VATYGEIARFVGTPRGAHAVGRALNGNPDLVVVPCHRVVRADGGVGGYAGGVSRKAQLLRGEGVEVENNAIDLERFGCTLTFVV